MVFARMDPWKKQAIREDERDCGLATFADRDLNQVAQSMSHIRNKGTKTGWVAEYEQTSDRFGLSLSSPNPKSPKGVLVNVAHNYWWQTFLFPFCTLEERNRLKS